MKRSAHMNDGIGKRRAFQRSLAFFLVLSFAGSLWSQQIVDTNKEYKVKAVYLYSFGRFTRWPAPVDSRSNEAFRIGVVGDSPISVTLSKVARKRKIRDKTIVIKPYPSAAAVKSGECDIVFIARSIPTSEASVLLDRLRDSSILTVTESNARSIGTVVNFTLEADSIHFELNLEEAQHKKLSMDARLLRQGRRMLPSDPNQGP